MRGYVCACVRVRKCGCARVGVGVSGCRFCVVGCVVVDIQVCRFAGFVWLGAWLWISRCVGVSVGVHVWVWVRDVHPVRESE